jgi:AcrR family transcriptional regulator
MPSDTTSAVTSGEAGARARTRRPSPRERLLEAADELFYADGVHTVGIDRILERADVARASLYGTFGSKEELIRAYLDRRMTRMQARLQAAADAYDDPRQRLLSVFDAQAVTFAQPGYRGCAFNRASAEAQPDSAAYEVPRAYRHWQRGYLTDLSAATGVAEPDVLARQIHLLYDGAMTARSLDADADVTASARAAAAALLDTALKG